MDLGKLILNHYLQYAKSTIISRAITGIDGFKPVQKRILYSMYEAGIKPDGNNRKSVKIVGDTMGKYHPHGDTSIYEAMVMMTTAYEGLNVPYIKSKGNFGKVYSNSIKYSAMRYTEARLNNIAMELFDGIKENAVDFVPNFDETEEEPVLLPVKFPNILVNPNSGVAVGVSSNIPSFGLRNVCKATQEVIKGTVKEPKDLVPLLGVPQFTTGGFLHASEKSLQKLCETGRGSFTISGHVDIYTNQIVIDEIPFSTAAEDIVDAIDEQLKNGNFKGIKDVKDEIGLEGLRIVVDIKNGYNSREVLRELCRLTPLRKNISFRTLVIIDGRYMELNLLEVLQYWLEFRHNCIQRQYQFKLDKDTKEEHLLATWELILPHIKEVVAMIGSNTDEAAKQKLISDYGLDEIQAEYLLEMKIRSITTDRANKSIKKLQNLRESIKYNKSVVESKDVRNKIIIEQLDEISKKYGFDNKTIQANELTEEDKKLPEVKISDEVVTVVFTKEGYVKRLVSTNTILNKYESPSGDKEVLRWVLKNNEHILVFDRFGTVHKVLVDDIDSSRGKPVDLLYKKANLEKAEDLIWADACGDYSKHFNIIYPHGKGRRVYYSDATGKRAQYKGLYEEVSPGRYWITTEDKFFMVTNKNKATYVDLTNLGVISNRTSFKVARLSTGDWYKTMILYKNIPNPGLIDLDKYNKDYTVSIGNDVLWIDTEAIEEAKRLRKEYMDKKFQSKDEEAKDTDKADENEQNTEENSEETLENEVTA